MANNDFVCTMLVDRAFYAGYNSAFVVPDAFNYEGTAYEPLLEGLIETMRAQWWCPMKRSGEIGLSADIWQLKEYEVQEFLRMSMHDKAEHSEPRQEAEKLAMAQAEVDMWIEVETLAEEARDRIVAFARMEGQICAYKKLAVIQQIENQYHFPHGFLLGHFV